MPQNLLTIALPTRERAETLVHALKTVCRQPSRDITILVSDNISADNTKAVVDSFRDTRIEYIQPTNRLSMVEHFEFVLGHVKSDYVLFLGDDDGLMPDSVSRITKLIEKHRSPMAITSPEGGFQWEGVTYATQRSTSPPGFIYFPIGSRTYWRDSLSSLQAFANMELGVHDLPSIYWGVVRMDVVASARREGLFFHSWTPDSYSSIAVASVCSRYLYSEEPFVLPGASKRSTGLSIALQAPGVYQAGSEAARHLNEGGMPWSLDVPFVQLAGLVRLEGLLQARKYGLLPQAIQINHEKIFESDVREAMDQPSPLREATLEKLEPYARSLGKTIPPLVEDLITQANRPAAPVRKLRYDWKVGMVSGQCPPISVKTIDDAVLYLHKQLRFKRLYWAFHSFYKYYTANKEKIPIRQLRRIYRSLRRTAKKVIRQVFFLHTEAGRELARHRFSLWRSYMANYVRLRTRIAAVRSSGRSIVVISQIVHMGNIVACEPVIRYVRRTQPHAFIIMAVQNNYRELADSHPEINHTLALECPSEWIRFANSGLFDQIIDLNIQRALLSDLRHSLGSKRWEARY